MHPSTVEGSMGIETAQTYVKEHLPAAALIALLVVVAALGAIAATVSKQPSTTTAEVDSTALVGTWNSSDGNGRKVFNGNGEQCEGFLYIAKSPTPISDPMFCTMSDKQNPQNRYALATIQSANSATYQIAFTDKNHATVYNPEGTKLYELTRS